MKETLDFLYELALNNNREWFEANKSRFRRVQEYTNQLAMDMVTGIAAFDPSVAGLEVKDCTYRIYRDTRFSNDKTPYKTHVGIYVCPGGKKSWNAGYYLHIEPRMEGITGGPLATSGLYMPSPEVLRALREDLEDHGGVYERAIAAAKGFEIERSNTLKRNPTGFAESPYDYLIRLKDLYIVKKLDPAEMVREGFFAQLMRDYASTCDLIKLLNRVAMADRD